ncbi:MAG: hypothetical protein QJR14_08700 [Bacillota bacterium]|nr:hypothetical protein [Bacillota bacterium]
MIDDRTFLERGGSVVRVDVDVSGCGLVRLSDGEVPWTTTGDHRGGAAFNKLLAQALAPPLQEFYGSRPRTDAPGGG